VVPLVYHVSEAEVLEWDAGKAFRRYELALKRLGVKRR
jgi:hypothetical protein